MITKNFSTNAISNDRNGTGNVVNVWGRKFILCDMDDFTKEFYRTKYDLADFTPMQYKAPPSAKQDKGKKEFSIHGAIMTLKPILTPNSIFIEPTKN